MSKLTNKSVNKVFEDYKKKISSAIRNGNLEKAASLIEKTAKWAVLFNFKYTDKELDDFVREIAHSVDTEPLFDPQPGRLVFLCSQLNDAGELVRQYSRAIADNNIPTRMIVIDRISNNIKTKNEIKGFKNIELILLSPKLGNIETAKQIRGLIAEFRPEKILQHFVPHEVRLLLAVSLFSNTLKYNINYTDHTFWIGSSFIFHNIEFRSAGCKISHEKRGISYDKMSFLPYYPIIENDIPFEGMPFDRNGKVVIFSGSVPYKVIGDNDRYFKTLDRILVENDNCVALIAINSRIMIEKINKICNRSRKKIYIAPWRKDILELMKEIDIFYNTYPVGGGLICQMAAINMKPIISYTQEDWPLDDVDGALFNRTDRRISFSDVNKLCEYAQLLCRDEEYRKSEGRRLYNMLSTREMFAKQFNNIINDIKVNKINVRKEISFNYERIEDFYLNYENETKQYLYNLFIEEGLSVFINYPQFSIGFITLIIKKTPVYLNNRLKEITNILWQRKKN